MDWPFLLKITIAHLLGDFALQTDRVAGEKHRTRVLLLHGGIHALLLVAVGLTEPSSPRLWGVLGGLAILHFFIDAITTRVRERGWGRLALDQGLHAATLLVAGGWVRPRELEAAATGLATMLAPAPVPIVVVGVLVAVFVGQVFVGLWVRPFADALREAGGEKPGLQRAGRWIGLFERALIYVAIVGSMEALVGFVIAAKALIRLPEARDPSARGLAEYYLVGTLASASWAVLTAAIVRSVLQAIAATG